MPSRFTNNRLVWPALGLLLLLGVNLASDPGFFAIALVDGRLSGDIVSIVLQAAKIVPLAVGMTLVIATGGVDLSVGSVMAVAATLAALLAAAGAPLVLALLAACAAAALVGAAAGALVAFAKLQPIVATLIMMVLCRGVAMAMTEGQGKPIVDPAFLYLGSGYFLGLPVAALLAFAFALATGLFLSKTASGLLISAVGDNAAASRLCGVRAARLKVGIYAFCGLCAAFAGVIAAARVEIADPARVGELHELDAIFAVVVGGTALTGGRFSIAGSVVGALLIQTLVWTMQKLGVPSNVTPVPKALVILLVCLLGSPRFRAQLAAPFLRRPATTTT